MKSDYSALKHSVVVLSILAVSVVGICGCSGDTKDEETAYKQLQAKPMTDQQKQMLDKIKSSGGTGDVHAGAHGGH